MLLRKSRRRRTLPCHRGQRWTTLSSGISHSGDLDVGYKFEPICASNTVLKSSSGTFSYAMAIVGCGFALKLSRC